MKTKSRIRGKKPPAPPGSQQGLRNYGGLTCPLTPCCPAWALSIPTCIPRRRGLRWAWSRQAPHALPPGYLRPLGGGELHSWKSRLLGAGVGQVQAWPWQPHPLHPSSLCPMGGGGGGAGVRGCTPGWGDSGERRVVVQGPSQASLLAEAWMLSH